MESDEHPTRRAPCGNNARTRLAKDPVHYLQSLGLGRAPTGHLWPWLCTRGTNKAHERHKKRELIMIARLKLYDDHHADAVCGPDVYLPIYLCDECVQRVRRSAVREGSEVRQEGQGRRDGRGPQLQHRRQPSRAGACEGRCRDRQELGRRVAP